MPVRPLALALAGLLLGLPAVSGCASQAPAATGPVADVSMPADTDGLNGVVLPRPYRVPVTRLVDTTGAPLDLATDARKPLTLVFFGYTNCPDICQAVMAGIASALVRLDAGQRAQVDVVFVTTDPARDDEETLRAYLDRFDPSFTGATGRLDRIVRVASALAVPIEKGRRLASGGYDVTHGTQVLGLLPGGRAPFVWPESTDPAALADDITTILDDKVPGL
ncbi:MAG TPA: SCO family protein [Nocardioidaceae bacterium]|nr:SCO family protein [Nocardioidaceae bacterium]